MASFIWWQIRTPAESPLTLAQQQSFGLRDQQHNLLNVDTWVYVCVCVSVCVGTVWPVGGGETLVFRDDQVKHVNALYEPKVFLLLPPPVAASGADRLPAFERVSIAQMKPHSALTSNTTSSTSSTTTSSTTSSTTVEESGRTFSNVAPTQTELKIRSLNEQHVDNFLSEEKELHEE